MLLDKIQADFPGNKPWKSIHNMQLLFQAILFFRVRSEWLFWDPPQRKFDKLKVIIILQTWSFFQETYKLFLVVTFHLLPNFEIFK